MKGDFSKWSFNTPGDNFTGVLQQQGKVLLDSDWNAAQRMESDWKTAAAQDSFGPGVAAVPAEVAASFKVKNAKVVKDAAGQDAVEISFDGGHLWADGILLHSAAPLQPLQADYLAPPFDATGIGVADIGGKSVRDAVLLEVWEESVHALQQPRDLLEPALGGPDTTERSRAVYALRLLRLSHNDECSTVRGRLQEDRSKLGRLSVSPAQALSIAGDCPLEAGGGYTGLEHYLYRIEIGQPKAGQARFKWSQFNGGLVGLGSFDAASKKVTIAANNPMINHCGLPGFYLEALRYNAQKGRWEEFFGAAAVLSAPDELSLTQDWGDWPTAGSEVFFRLWNGIAEIKAFPTGLAAANELKDGLCLAFEAQAADLANYRPGDFWTFPARAPGVAFDLSLWPTAAIPEGVLYHRVPLAILEWQADKTATYDKGQIDDCRRVFRPLTQQKLCCSYTVGDGKTSHGDFDAIQEALNHLPAQGGELCLLPGVHQGGVVIKNRRNVRIHGCAHRTRVVPNALLPQAPLFSITHSRDIVLERMDLVSFKGTAIWTGNQGAAELPGKLLGERGLLDLTLQSPAVSELIVRETRILAGEHAIAADQAHQLLIERNEIVMLDREGAGVAVFCRGEDIRIERNSVTVLPAKRVPPVRVDEGDDPVTPDQPCENFIRLYASPKQMMAYTDAIWLIVGSIIIGQNKEPPFKALGGIQVGAGSERARLLDNQIRGGAGNGISLGGLLAMPQTEQQDATDAQAFTVSSSGGRIAGMVGVPSGQDDNGIQLSFTHSVTGQVLNAVSNDSGAFAVKAAQGSYRVDVLTPGWAITDVKATPLETGNVYTIVLETAAELPPLAELLAFIYDVEIAENRIDGMGLNGIGNPVLPELVASAAPQSFGASTHLEAKANRANPLLWLFALLGNAVIGLAIRGNRITHCLQNPFDTAMLALSNVRGMGGISLGMADRARIVGNHIEGNGLSLLDPVCGIHVLYGEEVDILHNHVLGNGPGQLLGDNQALHGGLRGGVVVSTAVAFNLLDILGGSEAAFVHLRPAARIQNNVIDQPAGQALTLLAFGPLSVTGNSFSSNVTGPGVWEKLAGTVLIYNLGGVQKQGGGHVVKKQAAEATLVMSDSGNAAAGAASTAPADTVETAASDAAPSRHYMRGVAMEVTRAPGAYQVLPTGHTLFSNNQSRTGPASTAYNCQLIGAMDDLSYGDNQSRSDQLSTLFSNVFLGSGTLRAVNNRMSEFGRGNVVFSLYSLARYMNITSLNQGDHCIVATDQNPDMPEVTSGNLVLNAPAWCRGTNQMSDNLLKLLR